jgi:trimethylamine--corrinoid protein Co-methyltransferase
MVNGHSKKEGSMNHSQASGTGNRILSQDQIEKINRYTFELLEEVGVWVQSEEALDILRNAGCDVRDVKRVKIPRRLVLEAIEAAPKEIRVFDRKGHLAMTLKTDACYYGTGSDCPHTIDFESGQRRTCVKRDIEELSRFCENLPNINFVMSFGIANDAPTGTNFIHQYEAMLLNTIKPVIVTGHGKRDMKTMIDMAAAVTGGYPALHKLPPLILYSEPMSPLIHTEMGVSKALLCSEHGVPFIYIGSPMMGGSGPATLAGILVQANAESLSGLVIFQKKHPGAKFIYGGDATCMDMKNSIFAYGAPELNILNAGLADLAHSYGLPFFCIAGSTDSKTLDAQAGLEYALSIYLSTLNGCNIIHDCGYLEQGLTSSFESVLFADEVIDLVKYMLRPLEVNDRTVPMEVFRRVGPGGHFLMDPHTMEHFRRQFWFPRLMDRTRSGTTRSEEDRGMWERIHQKAREIRSSMKVPGLPSDLQNKIHRIVQAHIPDVD